MTELANALVGGHDAPLVDRKDDVLNRWSVARAIDRVISNAPQGWSTRVGLYGPWGTGKTSVLRFLRTLSEERGDIVVEFSAWQSHGEGGVLQLFHKELLKALEARRIHVEPRSTWLKRKLSSVAEVGRSLGSAGARAGGSVDGDLGQAVTVVAMAMDLASGAIGGLVRLRPADLEKLHKALGTRRVVIFVDDLDRADPRVVPKTLLALRELLDWPNFAFVLAFDKAVVASALGEYSKAFGQSADDFLEKVVDVPFELLEPTPEQVSTLALKAMNGLCAFIPIESRVRAAKFFPANPRQAKQVVRVLSALKLVAERHDPSELNWSGIMMQTILRLAAPDVASVFEAQVIGANFGEWETPDERKAAVTSAVKDSLAADRRLMDLSMGHRQRRTEWLSALMSDIQTVRRNDGVDRLTYEMRLVVEEPAFTHKEVRELVSKWSSRIETIDIHEEIAKAMFRSNATATACAEDLIHSSLARLRASNDGILRALTTYSAEAAQAVLNEAVGWIEFVWMSNDVDTVQARRTLEASSKLLSATTEFAARASGTAALELLRRERDIALASARECEQPWEVYFVAAPQRGRPSSGLAVEILDCVSAALAPVIAEELLSMFERQNGVELGLRRDAETGRGELLWALEVVDSPLYSTACRERLIALFEFSRTEVGERATNIIQNAARYLATVSMMSIDSGWITDYQAFAAAQGEVLTTAWQAATSESEEFRSAQFLSRLLSHLTARGLPKELFPIPQWMTDELARSLGASAPALTPPVVLNAGR